ncbi:MAG: hypothetical protein HFG38_04520 [Eubacterium sp.]|nr:hypothetical protein [Eubacterium sp.]
MVASEIGQLAQQSAQSVEDVQVNSLNDTQKIFMELSRVVEESGNDMNELKNSVEILLKNLGKFKM